MHYHTSHDLSPYSYAAVTVSLDVELSPFLNGEGDTRQVCVSVSQDADGGRACPLDISLSTAGYGTKPGEHMALDNMGVALDRVGVSLDRVGVALYKVSTALDRVGVSLDRVGVALYKVSKALYKVGVALNNVGVALDKVGVALDKVGVALE